MNTIAAFFLAHTDEVSRVGAGAWARLGWRAGRRSGGGRDGLGVGHRELLVVVVVVGAVELELERVIHVETPPCSLPNRSQHGAGCAESRARAARDARAGQSAARHGPNAEPGRVRVEHELRVERRARVEVRPAAAIRVLFQALLLCPACAPINSSLIRESLFSSRFTSFIYE